MVLDSGDTNLSPVTRNGNVRIAVVNGLCADEVQHNRVLADMVKRGEVQFDGNFIFIAFPKILHHTSDILTGSINPNEPIFLERKLYE